MEHLGGQRSDAHFGAKKRISSSQYTVSAFGCLFLLHGRTHSMGYTRLFCCLFLYTRCLCIVVVDRYTILSTRPWSALYELGLRFPFRRASRDSSTVDDSQ